MFVNKSRVRITQKETLLQCETFVILFLCEDKDISRSALSSNFKFIAEFAVFKNLENDYWLLRLTSKKTYFERKSQCNKNNKVVPKPVAGILKEYVFIKVYFYVGTRSTPLEVSVKKGFLMIFRSIYKKTTPPASFLKKSQDWRSVTLLKRDSSKGVFL